MIRSKTFNYFNSLLNIRLTLVGFENSRERTFLNDGPEAAEVFLVIPFDRTPSIREETPVMALDPRTIELRLDKVEKPTERKECERTEEDNRYKQTETDFLNRTHI